jgi:hypothetical protein
MVEVPRFGMRVAEDRRRPVELDEFGVGEVGQHGGIGDLDVLAAEDHVRQVAEVALDTFVDEAIVVARRDSGAQAAIQSVRRSRALPCFDSLVLPRNWPDWRVARSRPQNFRARLRTSAAAGSRRHHWPQATISGRRFSSRSERA